MDKHVNQLGQIAQSGELAIVTGAICNEKNSWKILLDEIFSFIANEEGLKDYIEEIKKRAIPVEVALRVLYQDFDEQVLSLLKCFDHGSPCMLHRQIASLMKSKALSFLGTTAIDNRLAQALKEENGVAPKLVFINGEQDNDDSLKDSLSVTEANFSGLRVAGENFLRSLKQAKAILVIGIEPGEYCWKTVYGRLLAIAKEGKSVYWVSENPQIALKHLGALDQSELIQAKPTNFLSALLKEIGGKLPEEKEGKDLDFSPVAKWMSDNFFPEQKRYFAALQLKSIISRPHAYNVFEKLAGHYQQARDQRQLALCHRHMGQILFEQGYLEKSIEIHEKAMDFWAKTSDEKGMAREHMLLGDTFWNGASVEKAVQHYGEALSIYRKDNMQKEISDAASKLAFICDEDGDYELSKRYYAESLQAARKLDNPIGLIITLLNFSTSLVKDKGWEQAKLYLEEAMSLSEKENESYYFGDIYQHLGLVYMNMENYPTARLYYEKAYQFYKKREEKISLTFVYCNLGHVCVRLEDFDAAVEYYEGALESYEKMGDWQHLAAVYNNLGFVNSNRQNYSLAEEYFSRAAEIFAALSDVYNLIRTHSNLGRVYSLEGELDNAIECYKANIEMLVQLNENEDLAATLVALAMVQLQSKQFEEALSHMEKAIEIYTNLGMVQEKEDTLKIIETIKTNILPSSS